MKKTGIMGGTFNPIHNGHLELARKAKEQYALNEVLFIPCGEPYMKVAQKVTPGKIRAAMTALAIQDEPDFILSMIEMEHQGNTYTYETLESLKRDHPDTEYYFILGADNLFQITKWVMPERIFKNCCILAAVRDDKTVADMEAQIACLWQEYHAVIHLLKTDCIDISSSDIRRKVSQGESIEAYVPASVRKYIAEKGLYL